MMDNNVGKLLLMIVVLIVLVLLLVNFSEILELFKKIIDMSNSLRVPRT